MPGHLYVLTFLLEVHADGRRWLLSFCLSLTVTVIRPEGGSLASGWLSVDGVFLPNVGFPLSGQGSY